MTPPRTVTREPAQAARPSPAEYAVRLREELAKRADVFEALLPRGASIDRYVELVVSAVVDNPDLLECSVESVILAVREAASYGLEPTGLFGGAYLVPRWNRRTNRKEATFQTSYRGLLDLILASGVIRAVEVQLVRQHDEFELVYGSPADTFSHRPILDGTDPGDVVAGYIRVHFADGLTIIPRPMTRAAIDKVMRSSDGFDKPSSPWKTWWDQMALKTLLRDGVRFLPVSTVVSRVLEAENAGEPVPAEGAAEVRKSRTRALQERLRAKALGPGEATPSGSPTTAQDGQAAATAPAAAPEARHAPAEAPAAVPDARPPATPATCGATSDPNLGDVETCKLAAGHPGPHVSERDSRWPNR